MIREQLPLPTLWALCNTPADQYPSPTELPAASEWIDAPVPGTLATAAAASGYRLPDSNWDDCDWWYRCPFTLDATRRTGQRWFICFEGLATHAQVWLNGQVILVADNMFRTYEVDISAHIADANWLHIVFRSLTRQLADKKPRPRWKTNLVEHQQLRWHRTTLLGRIPGWTPPVKPIGPWRAVSLERRAQVSVTKLLLRPQANADGQAQLADTSSSDNSTAAVDIEVELSILDITSSATLIEQATAHLILDGVRFPLALHHQGERLTIAQQLAVEAPLWWPHTHGTAALVDYALEISIDGTSTTLDSGKLGFRQVTVARESSAGGDAALAIAVNGVPIFCRGACWSINDIDSLTGDPRELRRSLLLARDAGVNMLRIGGTMVYEQDTFYALCDELGIMVWQDFMFANMDYPADDQQFLANVTAEVSEQLQRLCRFACISVYCGNSEVQQQAAMFGMPAEHWQSPLFDASIPALCEQLHPGIPYFPSTPCEGALPFHIGTGLSHFYAVGAYQRALSDRIIEQVKFTPECLGFANIPADSTVNSVMGGGVFACHHPRWKAGVPRDTGTGWDFEDIRDHYLKSLYAEDPATLRYHNPGRYLQLSRSVTGEVMAQVFSRWRTSTRCGGALVWFFKDLVPGAGWGLLDAGNLPKAVYYYLRRVWAKRAVLLTDNGLDGLDITAINEMPAPFTGSLEFGLIDRGQTFTARETTPISITARGTITLNSDALLGRFYDTTYNYRFGPPKHELAFARLTDAQGSPVSEACYFPGTLKLTCQDKADIVTRIEPNDRGFSLTLRADRFLQCVDLDIRDHEPDDNFFHLLPQVDKVVQWRRRTDTPRSFRGTLSAVNLAHPIRLQL
ncbi:glycoside hydrolase family 2 protein [Exilibacterium tricleocarpae]|uniref:beta-mannosidase n=1 Tax=Exilibacterium tricleocarpae TaxID=2591008 RepID=A0A545T3J9_9GAMM|nr:glycoside hydrolase family 2 protein [Exilibacterium tricleocarpae]TQV71765.1 glycoside hydrolase family 2 protein [Exilibacterium tricleocarpae]